MILRLPTFQPANALPSSRRMRLSSRRCSAGRVPRYRTPLEFFRWLDFADRSLCTSLSHLHAKPCRLMMKYVVSPARGVTWTKSIRQGVDFVLAGSSRDLLVAPCAIPREPGRVSSQALLDLESAFRAKAVVRIL
jgi:hypothetical protein